MPRPRVKRKRKPRVPARRVEEKLAIWEAHRDPVGHKFYGKEKEDGEWKHFEFSVITERRMNRKAMYFWVRETIRKMKRRKLPPRHYYHAYDGFMHLHGFEWIKVEEITYDYKHTAT